MYDENQPLDKNNFHVSLEKVEKFEKYAQLMAICAPSALDDENSFSLYHHATDNFMRELDRLQDKIMLCSDGEELDQAIKNGKKAVFLTVEDARILHNDINRLAVLYWRKTRFLTLLWGGESCIGGSHNTNIGLTNFGKQVTKECFNIGIIPDISHASEKSADDVVEIALSANKPFIASHSNAYSVYDHSRNLRDRHIKTICELSGLIGISLCRSHLCNKKEETPTVNTVIKHIDYYLSKGAENSLAFGCDFDGTDLPDGISSISDIDKIANKLAQNGYSEKLINKIYFENAYNFIKKNLMPAIEQ